MGFGEWAERVAETAHDAGASWLGYETTAQREARERAEVAERSGERRRDVLADRNEQLHAGGEFDPPSITEQENWQSYSHHELYETNERSLDPAKAQEVAEAWRRIGTALAEIGPDLHREASGAIAGGWEGEAADVATASAEPLVQWMSDGGRAFQLTGNKVEQAGSAAGQVKAMVPAPQDYSIGRTLAAGIPGGFVGGGVDALAQMRERQEAERAAQETMQRVLTPTYDDVDRTVPVYPGLDGAPLPPPPPEEPPPVEPPPPPVEPQGRGRGGGDRSSADRAGADRTGVDPTGHDRGGGTGSPDGPAGSDPSWVPDQRPDGTPERVPPGGQRVPPPVLPGPVPLPGGVPGGAGGGRGGGPAPGGRGAGGRGTGRTPGARAGGTGNQPGPGGRAGVGAGSGAGARGVPAGGPAATGGARGGAGGAGAARRGEGGEDYEHERPGWLEEQDDVWMEGMPKTAPPVFGE
ncbi:PPE family protein [Saccharopolyspora sp. 6T]|uniref:PPE domain-containing protein n=1 Tax=Saccharopolyspora sp. 6T TaxID=2877238 RepID=UPI001CD64406|nr:PPE domain-containing protein [Saccharopolyspora sp. 6T]MCA1187313.1 PPE family protein [Saccharopolyspora sp. 6T]